MFKKFKDVFNKESKKEVSIEEVNETLLKQNEALLKQLCSIQGVKEAY